MLHYSVEKLLSDLFLFFDRDKHFKTSKEVSGIDMSEVKRFYKKISKNQIVYQEVRILYKDTLTTHTEELWICAWNLGISCQPHHILTLVSFFFSPLSRSKRRLGTYCRRCLPLPSHLKISEYTWSCLSFCRRRMESLSFLWLFWLKPSWSSSQRACKLLVGFCHGGTEWFKCLVIFCCRTLLLIDIETWGLMQQGKRILKILSEI